MNSNQPCIAGSSHLDARWLIDEHTLSLPGSRTEREGPSGHETASGVEVRQLLYPHYVSDGSFYPLGDLDIHILNCINAKLCTENFTENHTYPCMARIMDEGCGQWFYCKVLSMLKYLPPINPRPRLPLLFYERVLPHNNLLTMSITHYTTYSACSAILYSHY